MQTLQNYKTSSTRHIFQAKIKYYAILETLEAVLFDEMMTSKKILQLCSQNGVVTLMWLTLYDKAMWNQSVRLTILYKIQSGDIQKQTRLLNG